MSPTSSPAVLTGGRWVRVGMTARYIPHGHGPEWHGTRARAQRERTARAAAAAAEHAQTSWAWATPAARPLPEPDDRCAARLADLVAAFESFAPTASHRPSKEAA